MQVKRTSQQGFTLIEMIVAMAIFTIAILIIVGALVSLTNESRKARAVRVVMDNLGASVESMSRTMRMGSDFRCLENNPNNWCGNTSDDPQDVNNRTNDFCPITSGSGPNVAGGEECIQFIDQDGHYVRYRKETPSGENPRISMGVYTGGSWTWYPMTASELSISNLKFYVDDIGSMEQPKITLIVGGSAGTRAKELTTFQLQTTVSARTPKLPP